MEASVLRCVNPYDINPISGTCTGSASENEVAVTLGTQIKLEMEEFGDLAPFLSKNIPKPMINSTDELNTPVFDRKGPFNFMVHDDTYIELPAAADPFKFEYDTFRTGNSVLLNRQHNDFSVSAQLQDTNNCEVVNSVQGSEANLLFTASESDQGNILIIDNGNETPTHVLSEDQISASILKVEDTNSVLSVQSNENRFSNVSSPCDEYSFNNNLSTEAQTSVMSPKTETNLGIETPEDSTSSFAMSETTPKQIPKLKLDFSFNQSIELNTPEVIDSVVDLETSFNILDYVNDKDVTTVNIDDIHFDAPLTFKGLCTDKIKSEETASSKLRSRKRTRYDEDEDYVPPVKRKRSVRKQSVHSSDSDSEDEAPRSKRGRPQRRTSSISSDHSDASKYRELRDKNNEASRKSRLKRKMKDLTLQKEADELYERNVKLKAQVEEYERMVNNFRNNLFKIMLKK